MHFYARSRDVSSPTDSHLPVSMEEFCPHLYYWDGADGPNWQGWWLSPEVGSDSFMAFANGDIECPEKATNWRSGEGGIDLRVGVISSGPPSIVGVRAPTMMGLEGAYRDDGTTHNRGAGRRIYKRYRDLHADEVAGLDEPAVVTYSSAFTLNSLPSPIADISPVQQQQQQQGYHWRGGWGSTRLGERRRRQWHRARGGAV